MKKSIKNCDECGACSSLTDFMVVYCLPFLV